MALEDLNYDLCGTCYQSISDEEKLLYSDNTVDALTLYAKVYHCYIADLTMYISSLHY